MKEIQEQKKHKMSIGQQLEIISKVKEIEYQNSLVRMLLEKYNEKYEMLKKEQTDLLEKANQKIEKLENNNKMFKEALNQEMENLNKVLNQQSIELNQKAIQEVGSLTGKAENIILQSKQILDTILKGHIERITKETASIVEKCGKLQSDAQKRFESYYNRKKFMDYLIYINLV